MICRLMVNWSMMVIMCFSTIFHISNISRIVISNIVVDSLGTAIRQKHMVLAIGGIAITVFFLSEMKTSIIVFDSISVIVMGRMALVMGLMFGRMVGCRGMVNWSMMNWCMVNWGMVNWGMVNWGMMNWGMVNWGMMNGYRMM